MKALKLVSLLVLVGSLNAANAATATCQHGANGTINSAPTTEQTKIAALTGTNRPVYHAPAKQGASTAIRDAKPASDTN